MVCVWSLALIRGHPGLRTLGVVVAEDLLAAARPLGSPCRVVGGRLLSWSR